MHVPRVVLNSILVVGQHIRVSVGVVVCEGNLVADPRAGPPSTELGGERRHVSLGDAQGCGIQGPGEGLVRGVESRVDDLNDTPLAPLRRLVCAGEHRRIIDLIAGPPHNFRVHDRLAHAIGNDCLDTLHALDGREGGGGRLHGEALKHVVIVAHILGARTGRGGRYRLIDALSHPLTISTILELDDNRLLCIQGDPGVRGGLGLVRVGRKRGRRAHGRTSKGTCRYKRQRQPFPG